MGINKTLLGSLAVAFAALSAGAAVAQEWPNQPIRLIVPYSAGGAADTIARTVADELSKSLGQQVVVENVTGAGGVSGVSRVVASPSDGYTFGISNISTIVLTPIINPNVSYDPLEGMKHVAFLGGSPTVIVVSPESGLTSMDELAEYARNSGKLEGYGSSGNGTLSHITAMSYFEGIGVPVEHIAYQGTTQAFTDVMGGHIPFASGTFSTAKSYIDAGQLVPLAISTDERDPNYPDLVTFAEIGRPDLTSSTWFGMIAPAGIDPALAERMNGEISRILSWTRLKNVWRLKVLQASRWISTPWTPISASRLRSLARSLKRSRCSKSNAAPVSGAASSPPDTANQVTGSRSHEFAHFLGVKNSLT